MSADVARPISAAELRSTTMPLVPWRLRYAVAQDAVDEVRYRVVASLR